MFRCLILLLVALALAGCSPKRIYRQPDLTAPVPASTRPPSDRTDPAVARAMGAEAAMLASAQIGKPYRWGGHSPEQGFDCSGLVHWSYARLGVSLPRVVSGQRQAGRPVRPGELEPGDLVFFAIEGGRISHVGVYVGDDQFVHAPRRGMPVRRDSLNDPYWRERWNTSRRVAAE